ncbi:MAG: ATP-dependent Clp protease adapter ClpS [Myxococcota bacterium]
MAERFDHDSDVVTETRTKKQLKRPRLYKVLLHNDDYTTREFVVHVLQRVFHKPEPEAVRIMLHVHHNGIGVAGLYTREVAETKIRTVEQMARQHEYPLRLSMEPEDQGDDEEG